MYSYLYHLYSFTPCHVIRIIHAQLVQYRKLRASSASSNKKRKVGTKPKRMVGTKPKKTSGGGKKHHTNTEEDDDDDEDYKDDDYEPDDMDNILQVMDSKDDDVEEYAEEGGDRYV